MDIPSRAEGHGWPESHRTIDTRILNSAERSVPREQAEDREVTPASPTEPPHRTEPIPKRKREKLPGSWSAPARPKARPYRDRPVPKQAAEWGPAQGDASSSAQKLLRFVERRRELHPEISETLNFRDLLELVGQSHVVFGLISHRLMLSG
jgi:hypothetical protein